MSELLTKKQFADIVKRRLGYPMIKVEISDQQIFDHINYAVKKFKKWATGQATQEVYFTLMLSGGQTTYDMPVGVTDVIGYDGRGTTGGVTTLFSVENYLYSRGVFDPVMWMNGYDSYSMVSYHLALDFIETMNHYVVDKYNFKYHWVTNQLEIQPVPETGNALTITDGTTSAVFDSPGFILVRSYMVAGSTISEWPKDQNESYFYALDWIEDYVVARCKETIGYIRRKFSNFGSIGNQGISLDGDSLVSEAQGEMERLEEKLKLEEAYDAYGIYMGVI